MKIIIETIKSKHDGKPFINAEFTMSDDERLCLGDVNLTDIRNSIESIRATIAHGLNNADKPFRTTDLSHPFSKP